MSVLWESIVGASRYYERADGSLSVSECTHRVYSQSALTKNPAPFFNLLFLKSTHTTPPLRFTVAVFLNPLSLKSTGAAFLHNPGGQKSTQSVLWTKSMGGVISIHPVQSPGRDCKVENRNEVAVLFAHLVISSRIVVLIQNTHSCGSRRTRSHDLLL